MSDIQRANAELACRENSLVIDELFDARWSYDDVEAFAWRMMMQMVCRDMELDGNS